jgi:CRP-like cAMP-binding protein
VSVEIWKGGVMAVPPPMIDAPEPCALLADVPRDAIAALRPSTRRIAAGDALVEPDDPPTNVRVVLDGWASRQKTLRDGRRQIVGLILPNDLGSYWTPTSPPWTLEVRALTPCRVLCVEGPALAALVRRFPFLGSRLGERAAADASIMQAWLLNIGQRKAPERIAHLFCELAVRIGLSADAARPQRPVIPLTQQDLADALGMTSVHVNRVLQRLKAEGMIDIRKGAVTLVDVPALARVCEFDPSYLAPPRSYA